MKLYEQDEKPSEEFFILSMERSAEGACAWWRPEGMGYTGAIAEAGRFSREEAMLRADPPHHLAVPCNSVWVPASHAKALAKRALAKGRR